MKDHTKIGTNPYKEDEEPKVQILKHEGNEYQYIEHEIPDLDTFVANRNEEDNEMKYKTIRIFDIRDGRKLPFETKEEVVYRRRIINGDRKEKLKGTLFHNSRLKGTYKK